MRRENVDKLKPESELLHARRQILVAKQKLRAVLAAVDAEAAADTAWSVWDAAKRSPSAKAAPELKPRGGAAAPPVVTIGAAVAADDAIPADDIACSKCGSFECDDDNDILLCE